MKELEGMEELLHEQQFEKIEKILLEHLQNHRNDIDTLMKLAMVRLQFEDDDTAIHYLNEILKIEAFHFQALVIKMYLQNFYCNMDKDLDKIMHFDWKDPYRLSIADYIISWQYQDLYHGRWVEKEVYWLKKSIHTCSDLVWPYKKLARSHVNRKQFDDAKECYCHALRNVRSTEFSDEDAISAQAFIDEYITGVLMSDINYKLLKQDYESLKEKMKLL